MEKTTKTTKTTKKKNRFDAYEVALELVAELRSPIAAIRRLDGALADQAQRAACSIALNVGEGNERSGRDRMRFFAIAAGSAAEVGAAIEIARAAGYLDSASIARALELIDRERAMLWRLRHPLRP